MLMSAEVEECFFNFRLALNTILLVAKQLYSKCIVVQAVETKEQMEIYERMEYIVFQYRLCMAYDGCVCR